MSETGADSLEIEKVTELEESLACRIKSSSLDNKKEAVQKLTQLLAGDQIKYTLKILIPESTYTK